MFNLPIPPMPLPGMGLTTPVALPVGTVVAFAGKIASFPSEAPSDYTTNIEALGWMVCDGKEYEVSKYPELFAVLGYLYGGEDGKFKIPDYRGQFLRGVDGRTGEDSEDPDSRTNPDPSKEDNNHEVGSRQKDALKAHQHTYNAVQALATPSQEGKVAGASSISTEDTIDPIKPEKSISLHETRPKNVSVNYIIKYTNG